MVKLIQIRGKVEKFKLTSREGNAIMKSTNSNGAVDDLIRGAYFIIPRRDLEVVQ